MSSPSITFGALKAELRAELFPTGEPYNLRVAHDKMFVEAIYDLQQKVDCFQINNTQVVPFCATKFQCGMTVFTAPRGRIWRVSTVDRLVATTGEESGSAPIQWCSEIIYKQVDYCRLEKFLDKQLGCSCSMWSQVPPPYCTKTPSPRFTRFPVPDTSSYADFPELPLGFIYPTPTTDVSCGRSKTGVWAQHSGRIYLAPWIQSTELILVEWDGIKRDWTDDDLLDDDAQLKKAIKMYVQAQRARDYDCDQQKYLQYRAEYEDVRSWLWWECEQENKLRNCEPRKSRWSEVTLEEQAPLVLPPDSGGTTSTTTNEPPPPPTSTTSTTSEQPRGACCFEGPTCENNLTRTLCEAAGGVYMGDYSVCVGEELELAAVVAVSDVSGPSDVLTPDLDAGDYLVVWTQGAYSFVAGSWSAHGISLAYGGGNTGNLNPPTYSASAAAAEAFYNSIISSLSHNFTHTGGPMTLQLRDSFYGDNVLGDNPPVFAIYLRRVGCPPTTTTTSTPTTTTSTTTEEHRGACCVDGECIANVTLEQCNLLGGEYLNDGSTCEDDHTGNDHGVTIVCPTTTTTTSTTTSAGCEDGLPDTISCAPGGYLRVIRALVNYGDTDCNNCANPFPLDEGATCLSYPGQGADGMCPNYLGSGHNVCLEYVEYTIPDLVRVGCTNVWQTELFGPFAFGGRTFRVTVERDMGNGNLTLTLESSCTVNLRPYTIGVDPSCNIACEQGCLVVPGATTIASPHYDPCTGSVNGTTVNGSGYAADWEIDFGTW